MKKKLLLFLMFIAIFACFNAGEIVFAQTDELDEETLQNAVKAYRTGVMQYRLKSYDSAISSFKKALEYNPKMTDAYYNIASIYVAQKKYDEAYDIYLSLSKRYVDNPEVWIGLLRSLTRDFTYKYATVEFKKLYQEYWSNYIALADKKDIDEYADKYKEYVDKVGASSENKGDAVKTEKCYIIATVFGGWFGLHKFLKGKKIQGLLYLFTFGLFLIGWITDIVSEYKKWPEAPQKQTVKWILFAFLILMAVTELEYSIWTFVLFIVAAFLTIDVVWYNLSIKNKFIRIATPIILACVAFDLSSSPLPESSYGMWVTTEDTRYHYIELGEDDVKLYEEKDSNDYITVSGSYYKSKIYVSNDEDIEMIFSYDSSKKEMCLLNKEEKCSIKYELIKEEKKEDE